MKGLKRRFASRMRRVCCTCFMLAVACVLAPAIANAALFTLSDKNSTFGGDLGSSTGANSWTVDGVNQLAQQWFWIQTASGSPKDLSTITTTPTVTPLGTKQLTASYVNGSLPYSVQLGYILTGQSAGSQKSALNETITLNNTTSVSQQFSLFMYSDFILKGTTANQHVQIGAVNGNSTVEQDMGNSAVATNNFVAMNQANLGEVKLYSQTLTELMGASHLTLNNNLSGGPGNYTWALEWDFTIGPNGSAQISMLDNLVVPEPSSFALILMGIGAWVWRRQSRA